MGRRQLTPARQGPEDSGSLYGWLSSPREVNDLKIRKAFCEVGSFTRIEGAKFTVPASGKAAIWNEVPSLSPAVMNRKWLTMGIRWT